MKSVRLAIAITLLSVSMAGYASPAEAYSTTWRLANAQSYAEAGLRERYVFGGSTWRNNNRWDSDEGADCSGYAAKVWAVAKQTGYMTRYHPYSTYHFYFGFPYEVFKDRRYGAFLSAWVFRKSKGGPSDHMGLFRTRNSNGTWTTYEARGSAYGIVVYTRSLSTLISWNYRRTDRKHWVNT